MLRYFFNTPKNRSQSAPEALLLIFQPKKENFGPQNGPKKLVDSGGGASGALLTALLGPKWARMASRTPQRPLKTPYITQNALKNPALTHVF